AGKARAVEAEGNTLPRVDVIAGQLLDQMRANPRQCQFQVVVAKHDYQAAARLLHECAQRLPNLVKVLDDEIQLTVGAAVIEVHGPWLSQEVHHITIDYE